MDIHQEEFLMPKVDCIFKMIFGDERNKRVLMNFLRCAIHLEDDDLETLYFTNTELKKEFPDDKHGILDVAAKTRKGVQINIEIQLLYQSFLTKRVLYYWSKRFYEQLPAGHPFGELNRTITINIVNFKLFEQDSYRHVFYVMEEQTHKKLDDSLEIHFLELPKIPTELKNDKLADWLLFINAENKEVVEMLAEHNNDIRDAKSILDAISRDKAKRELYFSRQMAIHDEVSRQQEARDSGLKEGLQKGIEQGVQQGLLQGVQQGLQKGLQQGLQKGRMETIQILSTLGMSLEEIAGKLGISPEEIKALIKIEKRD